MLVLSRRLNESIHIGDNIVVKISQIKGSRVLLAIEAPAKVKIRRAELPVRPTEPPKRLEFITQEVDALFVG